MKRVLAMRAVILGSAAMLLLVAEAFAAGPLQFYPVTPCRVVDTRRAAGPTGGPSLASEITRSFPIVGGTCGVPATAKAAALNVTIASPTNPGFLIVYPYGIAQPLVSTLNWDTGEPALANGAIVPLTSDPNYNISVFPEIYGGGTVDLILDVTGYFQ
jgi:hypothetical protein